MSPGLRDALHLAWQRFLVALPNLSEARLASSKAVQFLRVWHYLNRAGIVGDYLEFGVHRGIGFDLALRTARRFFPPGSPPTPRFFAFDSFGGLPTPDPSRDAAVFHEGQYRATREAFDGTVRRSARGFEVRVVPGDFASSLTADLIATHGLSSAAFVNIDCDLYASTLHALRFVGPLLRTGSVLYFDDWFFAGGDMSRGEPGACAQWLAESPTLRLVDFGNVAIMGRLFVVNRRSQDTAPRPDRCSSNQDPDYGRTVTAPARGFNS